MGRIGLWPQLDSYLDCAAYAKAFEGQTKKMCKKKFIGSIWGLRNVDTKVSETCKKKQKNLTSFTQLIYSFTCHLQKKL